MKEKSYGSRVLCPAKISSKNKGKTKIFSDEGKLREFVISRLILKEQLKTLNRKETITERTWNIKKEKEHSKQPCA